MAILDIMLLPSHKNDLSVLIIVGSDFNGLNILPNSAYGKNTN
jgi:hypothetical protein